MTANESVPLEILVVDDEDVVRDVVAEILTSAGHHAHTAGSASDALMCLGTEKIDMVITDVCMPRMDGLELTAMIRRTNPKVPVVLMSGYCPDTSRIASEQLHVEGFVSKPFELATMIAAVNAIATGLSFSG